MRLFNLSVARETDGVGADFSISTFVTELSATGTEVEESATLSSRADTRIVYALDYAIDASKEITITYNSAPGSFALPFQFVAYRPGFAVSSSQQIGVNYTYGLIEFHGDWLGKTVTITYSPSYSVPDGQWQKRIETQLKYMLEVGTGQDGEDGADGQDGATWHTGTDVTGVTGQGGSNVVAGDLYLNTQTYNVYKCGGVGGQGPVWTLVCNIKGAAGATGNSFLQGVLAVSDGKVELKHGQTSLVRLGYDTAATSGSVDVRDDTSSVYASFHSAGGVPKYTSPAGITDSLVMGGDISYAYKSLGLPEGEISEFSSSQFLTAGAFSWGEAEGCLSVTDAYTNQPRIAVIQPGVYEAYMYVWMRMTSTPINAQFQMLMTPANYDVNNASNGFAVPTFAITTSYQSFFIPPAISKVTATNKFICVRCYGTPTGGTVSVDNKIMYKYAAIYVKKIK